MSSHTKVIHGTASDSLTRLKPQKLGRHYHKIPIQIRELGSKHPGIISDYFLRNYRINLDLLHVIVHEQHGGPAECLYQCPNGKVGFSIDRALLTEALECYYGGTGMPNQDTLPVSTSEQRMRTRLGSDIVQLFARSILSGMTFGKLTPLEKTYTEISWEYIAEFRYSSHLSGQQSSIFIYLDSDLTDELTSRLSNPASQRSFGNPLNQIKQLPVRLDSVIASLQMPLSQVLALSPGDILLIRLQERCDVLINQQKLFRGTIFEDDGSLFLTSLESVKNA